MQKATAGTINSEHGVLLNMASFAYIEKALQVAFQAAPENQRNEYLDTLGDSSPPLGFSRDGSEAKSPEETAILPSRISLATSDCNLRLTEEL